MPNNYQNPNKNPYRVNRQPVKQPVRQPIASKTVRSSIDFETQRVCPACGKLIKLSHNFCKFCGVDLSAIKALGNADRTLKELANAALNDSSPEVRKEAIDTLGELAEDEALGLLTYVLLNDPDERVRKEAADELGDIHNPISLDVMAKALKDRSPLVRKEAIEGLKKIKKENKPVETEKAIPREPETIEEEESVAYEKSEEEEEVEEEEEEPILTEIEPEDDNDKMYEI
jgi:HEAT repeat protein